jgi:hypothetical protein
MLPPGQVPHENGSTVNPSCGLDWRLKSLGTVQHGLKMVPAPIPLSVQSWTPDWILWMPTTVGFATAGSTGSMG